MSLEKVPHPINPKFGEVTKEEAENLMAQRSELEKQGKIKKNPPNLVEGPGGTMVPPEELTEEDVEAMQEKSRKEGSGGSY